MKQPLFVRNSIEIQAPAADVWDALVNPEKTKLYMFGCAAVSGWKPGDSLLWNAQHEGQEVTYAKGHITDIHPLRSLAFTTIDPNNPATPDRPENYTTVTYTLQQQNGKTLLSVSQGDFSTVAEGEKRYQEVKGHGEGWQPILEQIKKLVEGS